ncbi:MAG: hypothetical protein MMC33_003350 [Icmadophila ericetorum]|nr:hypothetical protein [Icmadophila ericetorum]
MAVKQLQVVVVGGSLGGLFTGIILKRLGHTVKILERNPTPLLHNQGAGIVAGGEVQEFFDKYDLTKTSVAVASKIRHYLDRSGNEIHREHSVQQMTSWDLLYHVLRANFDGVQSDYCRVPEPVEGEGLASYDYGHRVKGLKGQPNGVIELTSVNRHGTEEKHSADLAIGADGGSSTMRGLLTSNVEREYAGYVAFRGTVRESEVSQSATEAFVEKFAFYHSQGVQILAYTIPGANGSLEIGKRLINWVWYCNYAEDSTQFSELMTDSDGNRHHLTLPPRKMRAEVWNQQRDVAKKILPPQFAEIVSLTQHPFVQAITDVVSPSNVFHEGKVLLMGDALAGFRPHTAASTNQAALDAMLLGKMMDGEMSVEEWGRMTMEYARHMQRRGVEMGQRSQFGKHPLAD